MKKVRNFLQSNNYPPGELYDLPSSAKRFPDGAQYRIEIPSVEGPRALAAVLEAAQELRRDDPSHIPGQRHLDADGRRNPRDVPPGR